jgi:hypothetical protein
LPCLGVQLWTMFPDAVRVTLKVSPLAEVTVTM